MLVVRSSLLFGIVGCGLVALGAGGADEAPAPRAGLEADAAPAKAEAGPGLDAGSEEDAPDAATPDAPAAKTLRVMTFNIKHGDVGGLDGVAEAIKAEQADLVGLQEVDVDAERSGKINQALRLGQLTGMTSLFRTAINFPTGGSYGLALLSRFPVLASERVLLPSSGEQRILAVVNVELSKDRVIPVGIVHLDLEATARAAQATEIVAKLGSEPLAIVMGDFNAQPNDPSMTTLAGAFVDAWTAAGAGPGFTIPPANPARRIDYVLLGKGWPKATSAHVPASKASDHLPVVVDVPFPP